jgi:uncharacterized protein
MRNITRLLACVCLLLVGGTVASYAATPAENLAVGLKAVDSGDTKLALERLNIALDGGDGDAGFYLGRLAETGLGVPVDQPKAFALYKTAATRGSTKALNRLGMLALEGRAVKQDLVNGRRMVCEAASKGDADAAFNCAGVTADGKGGPADLVEAMRLYTVAAEPGTDGRLHIGAHVALGFAHGRGVGTPKDLRKALSYFELAAARGNPIALFEIGQMFEVGQPLAADPMKAHLYTTLAAAKGHSSAAEAVPRLARRLSPTQAEASRLAAMSWRPVDD